MASTSYYSHIDTLKVGAQLDDATQNAAITFRRLLGPENAEPLIALVYNWSDNMGMLLEHCETLQCQELGMFRASEDFDIEEQTAAAECRAHILDLLRIDQYFPRVGMPASPSVSPQTLCPLTLQQFNFELLHSPGSSTHAEVTEPRNSVRETEQGHEPSNLGVVLQETPNQDVCLTDWIEDNNKALQETIVCPDGGQFFADSDLHQWVRDEKMFEGLEGDFADILTDPVAYVDYTNAPSKKRKLRDTGLLRARHRIEKELCEKPTNCEFKLNPLLP